MHKILSLIFLPLSILAQNNSKVNSFNQMYDLLPTPDNYRTATGAPGHEYYQQQALGGGGGVFFFGGGVGGGGWGGGWGGGAFFGGGRAFFFLFFSGGGGGFGGGGGGINSDERQWAWMDEGLTTFVQYLTEQEFERNYPSGRGEAQKIVDYMSGDKNKMSPIMINPESAYQLGNNAYSKPATALNILRETIMGRELFDFAFKEYARRWAFKQPYPADFFRTMEDASGVDLDWFWRGWFFTNEHVDLAISNVKMKTVIPKDPKKKNENNKNENLLKPKTISTIRNATDIKQTYNEKDTSLNDFYSNYNKFIDLETETDDYQRSVAELTDAEIQMINSDKNFYEIEIEKIGGLIMPIIYEIKYDDGTAEIIRIPAEIWRKESETKISRIHITDKIISQIVLDPYLETADIDTKNNFFPRKTDSSKFEIFKRKTQSSQVNPMQKKGSGKKIIKP
ncbi:MAG: hypothetical protein IPO92_02030 [Saprospiraceae bacterium]|nr:hypothetical protein [Saprospiraceae bacterium]